MGPKLQTSSLNEYCTNQTCDDIQIFPPEFGNPLCCHDPQYDLLYRSDEWAWRNISRSVQSTVGIHFGNAYSLHKQIAYSRLSPMGRLMRMYCPLTEYHIMRDKEGRDFKTI